MADAYRSLLKNQIVNAMMTVRIQINAYEELACWLVVLTNVVLMLNVSHKAIVPFVSVPMSTMVIQGLNAHSKHVFQIKEDPNVNATRIVDWIRNVKMNVVLIHAELLMRVVVERIASHKIIGLSVNACQVIVAIQRLHAIHRSRQTNNVVPTQNVPSRSPVSTYTASTHVIVAPMPIVPLRITIQFALANLVTQEMLWLIASNSNVPPMMNVPMINSVPATNVYTHAL